MWLFFIFPALLWCRSRFNTHCFEKLTGCTMPQWLPVWLDLFCADWLSCGPLPSKIDFCASTPWSRAERHFWDTAEMCPEWKHISSSCHCFLMFSTIKINLFNSWSASMKLLFCQSTWTHELCDSLHWQTCFNKKEQYVYFDRSRVSALKEN